MTNNERFWIYAGLCVAIFAPSTPIDRLIAVVFGWGFLVAAGVTLFRKSPSNVSTPKE